MRWREYAVRGDGWCPRASKPGGVARLLLLSAAAFLCGCPRPPATPPTTSVREVPGSEWLRTLGIKGKYHTVTSGETIGSIARKYNIDPNWLEEANELPSTAKLKPGTMLFVPERMPGKEPAVPTERPEAFKVGPLPRSLRAGLSRPSSGAVTRSYSPSEGFHGIEIQPGPDGNFVAAGDGEVQLVGDNLPAVGKLILIRHVGEYITAYSGNFQPLVRPSQIVMRGDVIGRMERGERLQFRVFRNGEPLDPLKTAR